jgi:hypothetical protein
MKHYRMLSVVVGLALAGCTEATVIKTNPPGAKAWLFGQYLGETPVRMRASSGEWKALLAHNDYEMPYKLEMQGYETKEGRIPIRVSGRRIYKNINLLFIPLLCGNGFRPPRPEYEFALVPTGGAARPGEERLPKDVRQRLHKLESLRDQGAITSRDYEALRVQVLRDALLSDDNSSR